MNDRGKKEGQINNTISILLVVFGKISFLFMALTIVLRHLGIETYILCCRKCKPPYYYIPLFSVFFHAHFFPLPTLLSVKQPNPPYGKRWRLYILPQFLSNLTRPITHKVIYIYIYIFFFFWGGGGAKFVPVIATLPILGLKFIKLFSTFL